LVRSALCISVAFRLSQLVFSKRFECIRYQEQAECQLMASFPKFCREDKKNKVPVGLMINQKLSGFVFTESLNRFDQGRLLSHKRI
jgi:hypothetical protein